MTKLSFFLSVSKVKQNEKIAKQKSSNKQLDDVLKICKAFT